MGFLALPYFIFAQARKPFHLTWTDIEHSKYFDNRWKKMSLVNVEVPWHLNYIQVKAFKVSELRQSQNYLAMVDKQFIE